MIHIAAGVFLGLVLVGAAIWLLPLLIAGIFFFFTWPVWLLAAVLPKPRYPQPIKTPAAALGELVFVLAVIGLFVGFGMLRSHGG